MLTVSPAARAGIGTATRIVAVDGRPYTSELLHRAVRQSRTSPGPIALILVTDDRYRTVTIDYHGGERYPHLVRVPGTVDVLAHIMAPHRTH